MSDSLCGFDPSREYFAAVSTDGRLKVWNVSTKKLQHQFTQSSHLQVNYTCLQWGSSGQSKGPVIALGTHTGDIFCWDIRKGTQLFHWKSDSGSYPILDLCFSKSGSLFSCGESSMILQRDLSTGNIMRKFKADKKTVTKIELNAKEDCLISAGRSYIKIWDLSSGEMITKLSGQRSAVNGLSITGIDQCLYASSKNQRIINMWSLKDLESAELVQTFSCLSDPKSISSFCEAKKKRVKRRKSQSGEVIEKEMPIHSFLLAIQQKKLSIWQFSISMQQNKPFSPQTTVLMPKSDQEIDGIEFLSASFIDSSRIILARGSIVQPKFETITFRKQSEMIKRVQLEGTASGGLITSEDTKQKEENTNKNTEVNVVNEHETHMPARPKLPSSDVPKDDITLEEKLEQIEAARNREKVTKVNSQVESAAPSTDSVGVVLLQALESGDDQLLETCLSVDDIKIIQRTVERLPTEYILPFQNILIQKFQSKPYRATELIPWIQTIVMVHTSYLLTIPNLNASALSGLYQTIDSRLGSYNKLLKLSGRLDLLLSQINYREVQYRENILPMSSLSIDDIVSEGEDSDMEDSDSN